MSAILEITDGTTTVSLIDGTPFYLADWVPEISSAKSGGVYNSSPLSDGQKLASFRWNNVTESMDLKASNTSQDALIRGAQDLRRLLTLAKDYWVSKRSSNPVYIKAKASLETNARYAIIHTGSLATDDNYYAQPFIGPDCDSVMDELTLVFERGHWLSEIPGELPDCLPITSSQYLDYDEWTVRDSNPTGEVTAIIRSPAGTLVAADNGQVFVTWDGQTWTAKSFGGGFWDNDPGQIWGLCIDDSGNMYAAAANGIFISADSGVNWTRQDNTRSPSTINCIAWDAHHDALILADYGDGFYYSVNGGVTWTANNPEDYDELRCVAVHGNNVYVGGWGGTLGVHKYKPIGIAPRAGYPVSWTMYDSDHSLNGFFPNYDESELYATGVTGVRFVDDPYTDESVNTLDAETFAIAIKGDDERFFVSTDGEVAESDCLGTVVEQYLDGSDCNCLYYSSEFGELYAGTEDGNIYAKKILPNKSGLYTASCTGEALVTNIHTQFGINCMYQYDDSLGTWTDIYNGGSFPLTLFPDPVAVDDALYIGFSTDKITNMPALYNMVLDIATAEDCGTVTLERYIDTPGWGGDYNAVGNTLTPDGFNDYHFEEEDSGDSWTTTNNGGNTPTGYWMRFRVTAVGGSGIEPTVSKDIYSVQWPFVEISGDDVGGDIPALARIKIENRSSGIGSTPKYNGWEDGLDFNFPYTPFHKVIVGLRSLSRGATFTPYLNCSDVDMANADGITADNGDSTTFDTTLTALWPAGKVALYNPTGADDMAPRVTFEISDQMADMYRGKFRVFVRGYESGGDFGNISMRVSVSSGTVGNRQYTPTKSFDAIAPYWYNPTILDFGVINLAPVESSGIDDIPDKLLVSIECSAESSDTDLYLIDLILMPADEWICSAEATLGTIYSNCDAQRYIDIDSIQYPKSDIVAKLRDLDTDQESSIMKSSSGGPAILQANTDQRLWFLFIGKNADFGDDDEGTDDRTYLEDSGADFINLGLAEGDFVHNEDDYGSGGPITTYKVDRVEENNVYMTDTGWDGNLTWDDGDDYLVVTSVPTSPLHATCKVDVWAVQRYLAARGNR